MQKYGIRRTDIELTLDVQYGGRVHAKGVTYYVVVRKDKRRLRFQSRC